VPFAGGEWLRRRWKRREFGAATASAASYHNAEWDIHIGGYPDRDTCGFDEKFFAFGDFAHAGCEVGRKISTTAQSLTVADAVNHVGTVIADEQRSIGGDRDSDGAAIHPETAGIGHETREKRHRIHGGFSILESNEDNLVAGTRCAIPGTVFSDESATAIGFRELLAGVKRELKRGDMSS
jgi:hypothetical protein